LQETMFAITREWRSAPGRTAEFASVLAYKGRPTAKIARALDTESKLCYDSYTKKVHKQLEEGK